MSFLFLWETVVTAPFAFKPWCSIPMQLECPNCKATLQVPDEMAGKQGKCIHCGHRLVVPGAKPIMYFAIIALLGPGDEAIYANPGFPIYESMIKFQGADAVAIPLVEERGWTLDMDVLESKLSSDPRKRRRYYKGIYYRLPRGWRALGYFVFRYVLQLGFLDGRAGFYYNFLQSLWFRMLVDAKLAEAAGTEDDSAARAPDAQSTLSGPRNS